MTRIQNDKMLNNVINSVTAAVDQEKLSVAGSAGEGTEQLRNGRI